jgi:hypothetical protein
MWFSCVTPARLTGAGGEYAPKTGKARKCARSQAPLKRIFAHLGNKKGRHKPSFLTPKKCGRRRMLLYSE